MTIALEEAAQGFAAVGSEPRLDVLLSLVRAGPEGLAVGEVQDRVDLPASTLAHHLRFLAAAGLIEQEREGRVVRSRAAFERIEQLADFLLRECCSESKAPHGAGHHHDHDDNEDAA
ncbi:MAG: ArsR/SmtB family transcription factor [Geminicoccaceae bacterium]